MKHGRIITQLWANMKELQSKVLRPDRTGGVPDILSIPVRKRDQNKVRTPKPIYMEREGEKERKKERERIRKKRKMKENKK